MEGEFVMSKLYKKDFKWDRLHENTYLVTDEETHDIHILNETAFWLYDKCNDKEKNELIKDFLKECRFDDSTMISEAKKDCEEIIEEMIRLNMIYIK